MARTVLITGCSDGGLGSALAIACSKSGLRVFATARNLNKLNEVRAAGIETFSLDVLSDKSLTECVSSVSKITGGTLDILVNNAGAVWLTPIIDASVEEARKLFDLNVWSYITVTKAFLPLLLRSEKAIVANHTSVAGEVAVPFNNIYSASKAAITLLTVGLRAELSPFDIRVVEIKSGNVKSNINANQPVHSEVTSRSLYYPARQWINEFLTGRMLAKADIPTEQWASQVAAFLVSGSSNVIWLGGNASLVYWAKALLPTNIFEKIGADAGKMDQVSKTIRAYGKEKIIREIYGQ